MRDELILANLIRNKVDSHPDLDVLTFVAILQDGSFVEEVRSYRGLWDNGQRVAAALGEEGMQMGDTFGLLMLNHPEFADTMVGSSIAGTVFVPIDPRTKGHKLTYMLDFAECKGVIVADYTLPNLLECLPSLAHLEWIWVLQTNGETPLPEGARVSQGGTQIRVRPLGDVMAGPVPDIAVASIDPMAPMQMLYTSGTTGDPKAIMASHARFGNIAALGPVIGLTPEDRPYTGLSLTHANAQLITLGTILKMSLRGVISLKFTKSRLWDICRHYGCTTFNLLGGMTTAIYADPPQENDADNPVRYVLSAGMPIAIWDDFKKRFNVEIFEFYGCAEGGLTLNPPGQGGPAGSIGKAPPTMECTVRNEDDHEVPNGEAGELCFRDADGTCPPVTYYNNPEASAAKTAGGWFRSGDIGHKDTDGWIFFDFRAGGGIRRNGDFVNPAFVEKVIAEAPGISDVFVYGVHMPSNAPGEKEVVAAIVTASSGFQPRQIFDLCREQLESNFVPSYLQLVDEIPKTASEKPQERFLLEAFDTDADNIINI
jgi:crotonobetaine/carnitine-CoA ligase